MKKYQELSNWIYEKKDQLNLKKGWKIICEDPKFGRNFRKVSMLFFKKFAREYVLKSKIRKEYIPSYLKKI